MVVLVNAVGGKIGGAVNDLRSSLAELKNIQTGHRFVFLVGPSQADLGLALPDHVHWRVTSIGEAGWLRRLWWDQVTLRRILRQERADVLFSFFDFGVLCCPKPQLLFIRNPVHFSELFRTRILPRKNWRFRLLHRLRRWLVCRSVEAADAVLAPSASMLEMVRREVSLPDSKGRVNFLGAPEAAPGDEPRRDYRGPIRLLFSGYYYDHKDLSTALEALRLLRQRHGPRFRLVTTADPHGQLARTVAAASRDREQLEALGREDAVEVVGLVPHDQMLALYRDCHVLCYPTLAESFGHALVEAMQAGLPVAASDILVNRELARDAALYFTPGRAEELAARVEEIVTQASLRETLIQHGRERVRAFSWPEHVRRLLEALEQLARAPASRRS